jgi:S-DNA-T family DNA segregation ATPase FtsK/SpoIIIE
MRVFQSLPHLGGYILPDEAERIMRLIRRLERELDARSERFQALGVSTLADYQRLGKTDLADICVVIDNMAEFQNQYPDYRTELSALSDKGGALGIHFVVTGNRPTHALRIFSNAEIKVAFRLAEAHAYTDVLGRTGGMEPDPCVGRGLVRLEGELLEFQTAFPAEGENDIERIAALRRLVTQMDEAWTGQHPPALQALPEAVPLADLVTPATDWGQHKPASCPAPVGLDYDEIKPLTPRLRDGPHFIIAGPSQSGKTTLVRTWACALAEALSPRVLHLLLIDMDRKSLPHVLAYANSDESLQQAAAHLQQELAWRQRLVDAERAERGGAFDEDAFVRTRFPAVAVLIDAYERFTALASQNAQAQLATLAREGRDLGFHVILVGLQGDFSRYADALCKQVTLTRSGFLMAPATTQDGEILQVRVPPSVVNSQLGPGRGFYVQSGQEMTLFQAASCELDHVEEESLAARVERLATLGQQHDLAARWLHAQVTEENDASNQT